MRNKYIKIRKFPNKVVIILNNPPVNAENLKLLKEIYNTIRDIKNSIIIFFGSCITRKGTIIFSAGADLDEIKDYKTYCLAAMINKICTYLNKSDNYVVTIMGGDAIGGGWGMFFDMSDKIYFLKDSTITSGFTRNKITPGCGLSLLIKTLGSMGAYKFIKSEKSLKIEKLQSKLKNIFIEYNSINNTNKIINIVKILHKTAPHIAIGVKLKHEDNLSCLINSIIKNPKNASNIQLKFLRKSLL